MPSGAAKRMKLLLPIKTSKGQLIVQSREEEIEDQQAMAEPSDLDADSNATDDEGVELESASDADDNAGIDMDDGASDNELTPVEQMALEESKAEEMKISIANHAQSVMDNPQENVGHLRKLRLLLVNPLCQARPLLADYVVVSLCEVFKDILPSYQIRLATDAEKTQQATKETRRLRAFEETLLLNYRKYVALLRQAMRKPDGANSRLAKDKKISGWRKKRKRTAEKEEEEAAYSNRTVAIRCLSQLLAAHPNFNESSELIACLAPCLQTRSVEISSLVCSAFRQLFVEDRAGEASLRAVKSVCRVAIAAGTKVHADLLDVLASVRLDLPPPSKDQSSSKRLNHRQKLAKLSRNERRRDKQSADATRGLEELRHQESVAVRARLQQRCAELLLHVYLRVLRSKPAARALTAALTGLCRLAVRVNLDLLPDLFNALVRLLDWPDLSAAHSVEVVRTALALLSSEGEALTLDPRRFYLHLYKRLHRLVRNHSELAPSLSQTLIAALAGRRRHLPPMRPVNFLRRLVDAICQSAVSGGGGGVPEPAQACLLGCAARLFAVFPRAHRLLEPAEDVDDLDEGPIGGTAGQMATMVDDDPDLGGVSCQSCEPLLRRLATSDQVSPLIRRLVGQLLKQNFAAVLTATGGGAVADFDYAADRRAAAPDDDHDQHEEDHQEEPEPKTGRQKFNRLRHSKPQKSKAHQNGKKFGPGSKSGGRVNKRNNRGKR